MYILERVDLFHLQAANTVCVMTQVGVAKYVNNVLKPGLQNRYAYRYANQSPCVNVTTIGWHTGLHTSRSV